NLARGKPSAIKISKPRAVKRAPWNLTRDRGARYVNFIKRGNLNLRRMRPNFNSRCKSIFAIKIPSRQNSSRAVLNRKFNLAVRHPLQNQTHRHRLRITASRNFIRQKLLAAAQ
ncbi:hypothetical protein, partial [Campylobacter sp.]|uniref:hypothetical protein n=1 Tax=Campylobacter sp. TaxID=205 RepID=UPI0027B9D9B2